MLIIRIIHSGGSDRLMNNGMTCRSQHLLWYCTWGILELSSTCLADINRYVVMASLFIGSVYMFVLLRRSNVSASSASLFFVVVFFPYHNCN